MASPTFSGIRRWATGKLQPAYQVLSMDERGESEFKDDLEEGSYSETSAAAFDYRLHDQNECSPHIVIPGILSLLNILLLEPAIQAFRVLYIAYLVITSPIRRVCRRIQEEWPPVYEKLGVFKHLVPSLLQPGNGKPSRRVHPSAWLDGLRGICAFLVAIHHASLLWFSWKIHVGYGTDKGDTLLAQLPFPRILFNGPPQVAVFFVVSGYALSYKPLRLSRQGRHTEASEAIQSSIFRRHIRLFVAPVVFSFVAVILVQMDLYGKSGWGRVAIPTRGPKQQATFAAQVVDWLLHVRNLVNPLSRNLDRGRPFAYDMNYWTLPVEFDCSMIIFLCHAAFNRVRPRIRLALLFGMAWFAHLMVEWRIFLFLSGMFLCDLHFQLDGTGSGSPTAAVAGAPEMSHAAEVSPILPLVRSASPCRSLSPKTRAILRGLAATFSMLFALYLLSIPKLHADRGLGYWGLFKYFTPTFYHKAHQASHFWYSIGAVLAVVTIDRTPILQRFFLHPIPQYFGKISYCMYLVHGTLIWSAGHWLVKHATAITGVDTNAHYCSGVFLSAVVLFTLIFYVADALTRGVDVPSVKFGQWLYGKWTTSAEMEPTELPQPRNA